MSEPFRVVFLHGPAAAGKYTIGKLVAERLGVPLFHNHLTVDLVATLFDFGSEHFVRLRAEIWVNAFREAAAARRSFVFTFNPERTVDLTTIETMTSAVEAAGGEVHYVALQCSEEEVLRRLGDDSRKAFGKLTDGALFREFSADGGFDFPALPDALITIDTETCLPEQAAEEIVAALSY